MEMYMEDKCEEDVGSQFTGSDDCAPTLSSKHLRAQQIKIFIMGNKLQHPIEDEE